MALAGLASSTIHSALLKAVYISKAGLQGLLSYVATSSLEADYQGPAIIVQQPKPTLAHLINSQSKYTSGYH